METGTRLARAKLEQLGNELAKTMLTRLEQLAIIGVKDMLTMEETALYTGYSLTSLYTMCSRREIPYYKRGKNNYFKKSELDDWMAGERVETREETESRADFYLFAKSRKPSQKKSQKPSQKKSQKPSRKQVKQSL